MLKTKVSNILKLANPSVRTLYLTASDEEQEYFDERAGIIEYDADLTRNQAEYKAFLEILKLRRAKREAV